MINHIIHKQRVSLQIAGKEQALDYQDRVSSLFKNKLANRLDALFNTMASPHLIVRIDTLQLDLGTISAQDFEQELEEKIITALSKALSEIRETKTGRDGSVITSPARSMLDAFMYFIQHGILPWYGQIKNMGAWEAVMLKEFSGADREYIVRWMQKEKAQNQVIIKRLAGQLSDEFLKTLLMTAAPFLKDTWKDIYSDLLSVAYRLRAISQHVLRSMIWNSCFTMLPVQKKQEDALYLIVKNVYEQLSITPDDFIKRYSTIAAANLAASAGIRMAFERLAKNVYEVTNHRSPANDIEKELTGKRPSDDSPVEEISDTYDSGESLAKNIHEVTSPPSPANDIEKELKGKKPSDDSLVEEVIGTYDGGESIKNAGDETMEDEIRKDHTIEAGKINAGEPSEENADKTDGNSMYKTEDSGITAESFFKNSEVENYTKEAGKTDNIAGSENNPAVNKKQEKKYRPAHIDKIEETQYVSNSGIVILHPFLEMYFAEFGMLQEREFASLDACRRAVLLLHYLATGETAVAEFDLMLPKIICNLPLGETLPNQLELTDKEAEESDKLLQAVINYWPPLQNTSLEGLRNTFLQREGRLSAKENGWLLTIDQKTVDILLNKLPWGFSTIRLPWMENMLNVDWY